MNAPQISLAIFGNRISSAGYEPLFWFNAPPFPELPNLGYPGMAENPYYFVLRNDQSYTQYTLVHNNVKSYMAARLGMLKISISIPYGYALANRVSPLDLLLKLRETFVQQCMTPIAGMAEGYNFKERMVDDAVFKSVLSHYSLVPYRVAYRPMTGNGTALFIADMNVIRQLFFDTHYPEFVPYREIVVAPRGMAAEYAAQLQGLQIPRRLNLHLFVNGSHQAWTVRDYYEEPTQITSKKDPRAFEPLDLSFTVNQLMQMAYPLSNMGADGYGYRVEFEPERERVSVTLNPRPRMQQVRVCAEGVADVPSFLRNLQVFAANGVEKHVDGNGLFTLWGDELLSVPNVLYRAKDYEVKGVDLRDDTLYVQARKVHVSGGTTTLRSMAGDAQPKSISVAIWIMDNKDIRDLSRKVLISVMKPHTRESVQMNLHFEREPNGNGGYISYFQLPPQYAGDINLSFRTDTVSHEGHLHLKLGENKVRIAPEETKSLSFFIRYSRYLILAGVAVATLLLALFMALCVKHFFFSKKDKEQTEQTDSLAGRDTMRIVPPSTHPGDSVAIGSLREILGELAYPDLTFGDVDALVELARRDTTLPDTLRQRVMGYGEIVKYLRTGNIDAADKLQTEHHYLMPKHEQYFNAIWKSFVRADGRVVNYTREASLKAKDYFRRTYSEYQSFVDFNDRIPRSPDVANAQANPRDSNNAASKAKTTPVQKTGNNNVQTTERPERSQRSERPTQDRSAELLKKQQNKLK